MQKKLDQTKMGKCSGRPTVAKSGQPVANRQAAVGFGSVETVECS